MIVVVATRIVGVLLLIGAGALYMMFWRVVLPLRWRAFTILAVGLTGTFGTLCIIVGDWQVAIVSVGIAFPVGLASALRLYIREKKLLVKLRMYQAEFRQAQEESDEDKMVDIHALVHSYRCLLPGVKEAQKEDWED